MLRALLASPSISVAEPCIFFDPQKQTWSLGPAGISARQSYWQLGCFRIPKSDIGTQRHAGIGESSSWGRWLIESLLAFE